MKGIRAARIAVQSACLALFVSFVLWPDAVLPGEVFFRADALGAGTAALAGRAVGLSLLLAAGLLALTLAMGRVFCGWACPLGAISDGLDFLLGKRLRGRGLRRVKHCILISVLAAAALGVGIAWLLDPMGWAAHVVGVLSFAGGGGIAGAVFLAAFAVAALAFGRRGFCRVLCPLGSLLGVVSRLSAFRRRFDDGACTECGACERGCRAAAIGPGPAAFSRSECIHCRDCSTGCPESALGFGYGPPGLDDGAIAPRREHLISLVGGAALGLGLDRLCRDARDLRLVRPPGAVPEREIGALCMRCGSCARACPTGGIVPAGTEAGPLGVQTPLLVGREGGCDHDCNACGRVCPTGAIRELSLEDKREEKVGLASIDRGRCAPHRGERPCLVCYTACPLWAIRLEESGRRLDRGEALLVPRVDEEACTGCGLCEARCPVAGDAAIRVLPLGARSSLHVS